MVEGSRSLSHYKWFFVVLAIAYVFIAAVFAWRAWHYPGGPDTDSLESLEVALERRGLARTAQLVGALPHKDTRNSWDCMFEGDSCVSDANVSVRYSQRC